jgi:S1-C subfamily serine protease
VDLLDLVIILIVIGVALRGVLSGFLSQAGSLGGFVVGLILGAILAVWAAGAFASGAQRDFVVLMVFFGTAIVVGGIGEAVGEKLSGTAERHRLGPLDQILGAVFGVFVALFAVWILAATFQRSAGPAMAGEIQGSRILQALNGSLPPAPDVVARLERALGATRFPQVFAGLEPSPAPPVTGPNSAAVDAAVNAGRAATVKIEGLGCGGLVEGSGFIVAPDLVATNAHVVAGINNPEVLSSSGVQSATVVYFDPNMDFAVLRVHKGLGAQPLALDSNNESRGLVGAVLGYPGGGDFNFSPAAILQREEAVGRNIYDNAVVNRDIYVLQAVVRPGNSGGPLVTPNGTVVGVVFAMSTVTGNVGYALTSQEIIPEINAAKNDYSPVSTQMCVE